MGLPAAIRRNMQAVKSSFIYFTASGINKGIPFLLLPILTRYLSPEQFGIWSIFQVFIAFSIPMIGMAMHLNITRSFFTLEKEELAKLISNLFVSLFLTTNVFIFLLSLLVVFGILQLDIEHGWFYALPIIAFTNMINQFNLTILRNCHKAVTYGGFEIGNTLLNIGIALMLIVLYGFEWKGMVIGVAMSNILFSLFSILYIIKTGYFKLNVSSDTIKKIFVVSLPLLPHAIGSVVINLSDRLFIDQMIGKEAVGLYTVGFTFGMIVLLFTDSFNKAWSPWMYKQLANITDDKKKKIVNFTYAYIFAVGMLAVIVTLASYFLLEFMVDQRYYNAKEFIAWVALGYAVQGVYFMVFPYLVHVGKTNFLGVMTLIAAVINLVANYFLIKMNGAVGAAQATIIAYFIMVAGVWKFSNTIYPMPWKLGDKRV